MLVRRSSRNAAGVVLPTRLMVFSISAVALLGLAFIASQGDDNVPDKVSPSAITTTVPDPPAITEGPGGPTTPVVTVPPKPVNKAKTDVLILNNTNIMGLAGKVRTRAERLGWNVIDTTNWQGSVDESAVYYGPGMKRAGLLLAADLGIKAKKLFATNDLNPRRLNVILTGELP